MDLLQAVEYLPKIGGIIRRFRAAQPDVQSKFVAYVLAPTVAMSLVYVACGSPGTLFGADHSLSVIKLASRITADRVETHEGVAVVVEPTQLDCIVPLTPATRRYFISSLTPDEWQHNRTQLKIEGGDLHLKFPLFGVSRPIVILADGGAQPQVLIGGGRFPLETLQLTAQQSINLVMWGFVSAVFGLGLSLAAESDRLPLTENNG
jgi:hypothetical protein